MSSHICVPKLLFHVLSNLILNSGGCSRWCSFWRLARAFVSFSFSKEFRCSWLLSSQVMWVSPGKCVCSVLAGNILSRLHSFACNCQVWSHMGDTCIFHSAHFLLDRDSLSLFPKVSTILTLPKGFFSDTLVSTCWISFFSTPFGVYRMNNTV